MSIYTLRSGATAHSEDTFLQFFTDLIRLGGIKDLGTDNHLKVIQRVAGANMSVDVTLGKCFVRGTASNVYPVRMTANENVLIASNSGGTTRIDAIVVYIDLAASPDTTASNVAKLLRVAGTTVAPIDADIQTAVGASNPFLRLSDVTVANGAVSIVTANIADKRAKYKLNRSHRKGTVTCAATTDFNFAEYDILETVLDRSPIITFSGLEVDDMVMCTFTQNGAGNRAITLPGNIRWFGGVPSLTSTGGHSDSFIILCKTAGASPTYDGWAAGYDGV